MRYLLLSVLLLPACGGGLPSLPASVRPAHDGAAITAEERLVEAQLPKKNPTCHTIRFLRWGPHDLTAETHWKKPEEIKIVRVRWSYKEEGGPGGIRDELWVIYSDPSPANHGPYVYSNELGDDWMAVRIARKQAGAEDALKGP